MKKRQRLATNIRQLLDASGEGIYGLDSRGVVTFVNRRGSEMLGFESEALIGRKLHELTHHSHRDGTPYPASQCPMNRAAIVGVPCEVDDEVLWRSDGSQLQVGYTASPIRENGQLTGASYSFADTPSAADRARAHRRSRRGEAAAAPRATFSPRMSQS